MTAATDQQPYLQGYVSAMDLAAIINGPPLPGVGEHGLVHRDAEERERGQGSRCGRHRASEALDARARREVGAPARRLMGAQ